MRGLSRRSVSHIRQNSIDKSLAATHLLRVHMRKPTTGVTSRLQEVCEAVLMLRNMHVEVAEIVLAGGSPARGVIVFP